MRLLRLSGLLLLLAAFACGGDETAPPANPGPDDDVDPRADDPADDETPADDPEDSEDPADVVDPEVDPDVEDPEVEPEDPDQGLGAQEGEPNDDPTNAHPVRPGDQPGAIDPAGDDDWYSIELEAGQTLTAETSDGQGGCGLDTIVFVYAPAPAPVAVVTSCADDPGAAACDDDSGTDFCSIATLAAAAGGRYFVRVVEYGDDGTGAYVLTLTVSDGPRVEHEVEPNDGIASADPVRDGSIVAGAIDPAGDDDWFSIAVAAGDTVVAETSDGAGGCALDTVLVLYGEGAEPLADTWSCDDDPAEIGCNDDQGPGLCARLYFTAERAGTYSVRLLEWDDDETGPYELRVWVNPALTNQYACGDAAELEPNDDMSLAGIVCDGSRIEAAIDETREDDWYAVDLDEGQTVTASTSDGAGGCDLDTTVVVYDEQANPMRDTWSCDDDPAEIGCDDDGGSGDCSSLVFTAPAAGTYFLRVLEWNDDAAGRYFLDVSIGD